MKALSRIAIVLIGLVFGGLLAFHAYRMEWLQLASIELELAQNSSEQILFDGIRAGVASDLSLYQGKWLWKVNLKDIHKKILQDTRVQSATVSRAFPNRVRINVTPHKPIYGLLDAKGRVYPISAEGSLLPWVNATEGFDLPILRGLQFFDQPDLRKQAAALYSNLPIEGSFSRENLSEVRHSPREGFKLFLIKPEVQVLVGESELGSKTSRVEQVLRYLESRNLHGKVVDARMTGKVVVKVRE